MEPNSSQSPISSTRGVFSNSSYEKSEQYMKTYSVMSILVTDRYILDESWPKRDSTVVNFMRNFWNFQKNFFFSSCFWKRSYYSLFQSLLPPAPRPPPPPRIFKFTLILWFSFSFFLSNPSCKYHYNPNAILLPEDPSSRRPIKWIDAVIDTVCNSCKTQ